MHVKWAIDPYVLALPVRLPCAGAGWMSQVLITHLPTLPDHFPLARHRYSGRTEVGE